MFVFVFDGVFVFVFNVVVNVFVFNVVWLVAPEAGGRQRCPVTSERKREREKHIML